MCECKDIFESEAMDLLDMIKRMEQHSHDAKTIRFAMANFLRESFNALYDVRVEDDENFIRRDRIHELI